MSKEVRATIFEEYVSKILSGELSPGDRLPGERELAQRHGISKTTVHNAMLDLEERGLVSILPRSGTVVRNWVLEGNTTTITTLLLAASLSEPSEQLAHAFMEFRIINEGKCAALAAQRRSEQDMAHLKKWVKKIETAKDPKEYVEANSQFHLGVMAASKNPFFPLLFLAFQPVIVAWSDRLMQHRQLDALPTLKAICSMIERQDSVGAENLMNAYTTYSATLLKQILKGPR